LCRKAAVPHAKDGISDMAKVLDMKLENRIIQMKAVLTKNMELSQENGISFDFFSKGWDEAKRVEVQNGIFRGTKNHVDCCINDILMEENQRYFIEDGCIFIKTAGKTIGYSQIILESGEKPYIVNFGIIKNYRGQGFAKALLSYTLNSIRAKGFDEVFITVDAENYIALNLYKSMGFIKTNAFSSFLYKFP
jgi:ribosomal protein S18 acetylase RimI-like enzyme